MSVLGFDSFLGLLIQMKPEGLISVRSTASLGLRSARRAMKRWGGIEPGLRNAQPIGLFSDGALDGGADRVWLPSTKTHPLVISEFLTTRRVRIACRNRLEFALHQRGKEAFVRVT